MDESAVETVHRAVFTLVVGTGHVYVAISYFNFDIGVDFLRQGTLRALYSNYVVLYRHFHLSGEFNGSFTYS